MRNWPGATFYFLKKIRWPRPPLSFPFFSFKIHSFFDWKYHRTAKNVFMFHPYYALIFPFLPQVQRWFTEDRAPNEQRFLFWISSGRGRMIWTHSVFHFCLLFLFLKPLLAGRDTWEKTIDNSKAAKLFVDPLRTEGKKKKIESFLIICSK